MKKRYVLATIAALIILYIVIALWPYTGRVYVTAETKLAFNMQNFFGDYQSPERVMLVECPQDAFFHRLLLISNAQEEILLSSFAIHRGETSDIIAGALLAAADRGVQISILSNSIGGTISRRYANVLAAHNNINVYMFNRLNFLEPQFINASMHDKYMIVDDTFLILGGRNIGDKYYAPEGFTGRLSLDREVLVYNTDPTFQGSIADVRQYFTGKITSYRATVRNVESNSRLEAQKNDFIGLYESHIQTLETRAFDYYYNTVGVNRITLISNPTDTTRKESIVAYNLMMLTQNSQTIIAQSPYVVLTRRNLETFAQTVYGRDFTLLTNSLASTPNLPAFSAYHVTRRNILATGITIYEFQSTDVSVHAKTYLFDGRLTAIGSFNLNERSLRADTETMLIIDSEAFHDIVLAAINDQMAQSLRVGQDNRYIPNSAVEAAHTPMFKRGLFRMAGHALRPFRFMF